MGTPHVLCFQQRLTHYRESFFQQAKEALAAKGIAFDLVYGQPDAAAQIRKDSGHLPWAHAVQEKTFRLGKFTGVWVPTPAKRMAGLRQAGSGQTSGAVAKWPQIWQRTC